MMYVGLCHTHAYCLEVQHLIVIIYPMLLFCRKMFHSSAWLRLTFLQVYINTLILMPGLVWWTRVNCRYGDVVIILKPGSVTA